MSSTAFLDHCLYMIIIKECIPISLINVDLLTFNCNHNKSYFLNELKQFKLHNGHKTVKLSCLLPVLTTHAVSIWLKCSLCICHMLTCMNWFHTVRKWIYPLLTLPDCKHQEKHKENQAQSLHVWVPISFQTLLLAGWCCIYTALQPWGWSPSCSVQITITKYSWMMGVCGLEVRTISLLSLVNSWSFLKTENTFSHFTKNYSVFSLLFVKKQDSNATCQWLKMICAVHQNRSPK